MNRVVLVGRLTRDPELRSTQSGLSVCNFGIAVDRRVRRDGSQGQQTADFFNVVAWRRQAEVISQYMHKGSQIALEGRLQSRSYQANDGSRRTSVEIVLDNFDFIGSRNDNNGGGYNNNNNYNNGGYNNNNNYQQNAPANDMPLNGGDDDFDDDFSLMADDDDVPF